MISCMAAAAGSKPTMRVDTARPALATKAPASLRRTGSLSAAAEGWCTVIGRDLVGLDSPQRPPAAAVRLGFRIELPVCGPPRC
jgi:hypothetical protein